MTYLKDLPKKQQDEILNLITAGINRFIMHQIWSVVEPKETDPVTNYCRTTGDIVIP